MALEYDWYGDTDLDTATLRDFITTATGGEQHPDGTIFTPGMYVMARPVAGDEVDEAIRLFGFDDRFAATFRFSSTADEETTNRAAARMAHTVIDFAAAHGGHGVLLFNGETVVLRYGDGEVVLNAGWEDWSDNDQTAPLLDRFPSRVLPQPLL